MIELGGNIYFLAKLFSTDGFRSSTSPRDDRHATQEEYAEMMLAGGRPIRG